MIALKRVDLTPFEHDLAQVLKKHAIDVECQLPAEVLTGFLSSCLAAYTAASSYKDVPSSPIAVPRTASAALSPLETVFTQRLPSVIARLCTALSHANNMYKSPDSTPYKAMVIAAKEDSSERPFVYAVDVLITAPNAEDFVQTIRNLSRETDAERGIRILHVQVYSPSDTVTDVARGRVELVSDSPFPYPLPVYVAFVPDTYDIMITPLTTDEEYESLTSSGGVPEGACTLKGALYDCP